MCESVLFDVWRRLWEERGWCEADKKSRAAFLGCMYSFEMAGRIGEYTRQAQGSEDHCVRIDDLTFTIDTSGSARGLLGSALAASGLAELAKGRLQIMECRVL